jgi:hypothetical protein
MLKIEVGKMYLTRDGHLARIYATDGGDRYPVHGAIKRDRGWVQNDWTADGVWLLPRDGWKGPNAEDLVGLAPDYSGAPHHMLAGGAVPGQPEVWICVCGQRFNTHAELGEHFVLCQSHVE